MRVEAGVAFVSFVYEETKTKEVDSPLATQRDEGGLGLGRKQSSLIIMEKVGS